MALTISFWLFTSSVATCLLFQDFHTVFTQGKETLQLLAPYRELFCYIDVYCLMIHSCCLPFPCDLVWHQMFIFHHALCTCQQALGGLEKHTKQWTLTFAYWDLFYTEYLICFCFFQTFPSPKAWQNTVPLIKINSHIK